MKSLPIFTALIAVVVVVQSQSTTGSLNGTISYQKRAIKNVDILLLQENTANTYRTISNEKGEYFFAELMPGTNYSIRFLHAFSDTLLIYPLTIELGKTQVLNIILPPAANLLVPVTVLSTKPLQFNQDKYSIHLNADEINQQPSGGRSFSSLFTNQPLALVKNDGSGAISFAGQNHRYNSIYIDGSLQNDVFGLSPTGSFGGQAGSFPVATETIDQLQLLLSPFDASLGGFTGAALNMVSKSGKNNPVTTIYKYWNANKQVSTNSGISLSGPIKQNKLFYYFNADYSKAYSIVDYDLNLYKGDTKKAAQLRSFIHTLQAVHQYDPGTINSENNQYATRLSIRLDGKLNRKNSFTASARYLTATKNNTNQGSESLIVFNNNGKFINAKTISTSIEWRYQRNAFSSNKLTMGFTQSTDKTNPRGLPFPSLRILDGEGFFLFGSNEEANNNFLQQTLFSLVNKFSFSKGKQLWNIGIDLSYNNMQNSFLQNKYGSYFYYSLTDFLQNRTPGGYTVNYYTNNKTLSQKTIGINTTNAAFFVNHQFKFNKFISLQSGIRINYQQLLNTPIEDSFANSIALPIIQQYYTTNTLSGKKTLITPAIAPRLFLQIQIPEKGFSMNVGTGFFSGRMPFAWLGGMYSNNGLSTEFFEATNLQRRNIRFNKNPSAVWLPVNFGTVASKGVVNFTESTISMPMVWRTALQIQQQLPNQLQLSANLMYYYNKEEIQFTNINLIPATDTLQGPDNRLIHTPINHAAIPIMPDSSNPYEQIILLHNNKTQHGYGYQVGLQVQQITNTYEWKLQYTYGDAFSVQDGNYSILLNQWRLNEQVNGRNNIDLSRADFSAAHRMYISFTRHWLFIKKKKIALSFYYNGNSGSPFSYVYGKKNLSGDDFVSVGYDLLYIPTKEELAAQIFVPLISQEVYYTGEQQKEALEWYIMQNKYLNTNRGTYAKRNSVRAPFNHQITIKLSGYVPIKINKKKYGLGWSIELVNAANLINQNWGQFKQVLGNRVRLINFEGMLNSQSFIPTYSFDPYWLTKSIWEGKMENYLGFSRKWMLQLGCRISFY